MFKVSSAIYTILFICYLYYLFCAILRRLFQKITLAIKSKVMLISELKR